MSAAITLVTLGDFDLAAIADLASIASLQHAPAPVDSGADLFMNGDAINAVADKAPFDWVLIVRRGESIDAALARELVEAMREPVRAWGYRIRSRIVYDGVALHSSRGESAEIRMYHRRHARFDPRRKTPEIKVQGSVVRLRETIVRKLSSEEHRATLERSAVPHSALRHLLLFARELLRAGAHVNAKLVRFLWIETAFDQGRPSFPESYSAS